MREGKERKERKARKGEGEADGAMTEKGSASNGVRLARFDGKDRHGEMMDVDD